MVKKKTVLWIIGCFWFTFKLSFIYNTMMMMNVSIRCNVMFNLNCFIFTCIKFRFLYFFERTFVANHTWLPFCNRCLHQILIVNCMDKCLFCHQKHVVQDFELKISVVHESWMYNILYSNEKMTTICQQFNTERDVVCLFFCA